MNKYLIMTSSNPEELTKLYKFKNKYPKFIKYIDSAKENIYSSIIWNYNNEYYIINICRKDNKIISHNIFEDEKYYEIGINDPHYGIVKDNIL